MYGCIILGYYTGKLVNEDTKLGELKCGRGIDPNCWNFFNFFFFSFWAARSYISCCPVLSVFAVLTESMLEFSFYGYLAR